MPAERFTNAIHGEALSGDPEGFGDRRLEEPSHARLNSVDAPDTLSVSRVSVNDIVRDDPLGYAGAHPASAPAIDRS